MAAIVLYYSLGGTTRKVAEARAQREDAALCEIVETRKRNVLTAFIPGCPQAMSRKPSKIAPVQAALNGYDRFILCFPVWAGFPAPAFNAALELLPGKGAVELVLCSASGETPKSKESTVDLVKQRGFSPVSYEVVCTAPPKEPK